MSAWVGLPLNLPCSAYICIYKLPDSSYQDRPKPAAAAAAGLYLGIALTKDLPMRSAWAHPLSARSCTTLVAQINMIHWLHRAFAGVSAGDELNVEEVVQGITEKDAQQAALAKAAFQAVTAEYKQLEAAITDSGQRAAMSDAYQQPWLQ